MNAPNDRITLSISFTLRDICRALGGRNSAGYSSAPELVAALDDRQVRELLRRLAELALRP